MGLRNFPALTLLAAALAALPPQNKTARQLFYAEDTPAPSKETKQVKKVKKSPAPDQKVTAADSTPQAISAAYGEGSSRPLGLRYSLQQIQEGSPVEVNSDKVFRSGDQIKVQVEGNREGYLYVVNRGSSGAWKPLFPSAAIAGGNNRLAARSPLHLPSADHAFTFDDQPGEEQLFVVYSLQPVTDLDKLMYMVGKEGDAPAPKLVAQDPRPISDSLVKQLRTVYSRDLIIQAVSATQPAADWKPENAVYLVSNSGGRVVADIRLTHR